MRYKLLIVVGVALASVLALAVFRLGRTGNKGGSITEPNRTQQTGLVLSCPILMAHTCGSKGLFPTAPSHPQGGSARVHWAATS
jgi:hypothetical protein